jgi:hypothetical protein
MEIGAPLFIGFRVKTVPRADDLDLLGSTIVKHEAAEICSLSECLCKAPPGWEKRWDFNDACCYNSEAEALATIPPGDENKYQLFAYRMLPIEFGKTERRMLALPDEFGLKPLRPIAPELDLDDYQSVGYDIAGGPLSALWGFNHSPLSCNGMSSEVPVNRFWLIDDLESALRVADDFARTEPEPGPYYVYEVLRKKSDRWC